MFDSGVVMTFAPSFSERLIVFLQLQSSQHLTWFDAEHT